VSLISIPDFMRFIGLRLGAWERFAAPRRSLYGRRGVGGRVADGR
jgi:hypothetical protein